MTAKPLILASASPWRRAMLEAAGVNCRFQPADFDEAAHRKKMASRRFPPTPADVAEELAAGKAEAVSRQEPDALVIGSDQVLDLDGEIFSKPSDTAEARATLAQLRGRRHTLPTAVALAENGKTIWRHMSTPALTMRQFSDAYLNDYVVAQGDKLTWTVGSYEIEGRGIQLFSFVEGDYFAIVGLPLLPLLAELRRRGHLTE